MSRSYISYIGIYAIQGFISDKMTPTIDGWLNHIDYIVDVAGIDSVGIGTDFYCQSLPINLSRRLDQFLSKLGMGPQHGGSFEYKMKDFEVYSKFPNLVKGLISKGYSDTEIEKILALNFLRVFRKVVG